MGANRATIRGYVRKDLHDEDSSNYRWTDATLNRHIDRVVREYSQVWSWETFADLTAVAGQRQYGIQSLSSLLWVDRVECPYVSDQYPRKFAPFFVHNWVLYLQVEEAPAGGETIRVYYSGYHTVAETGSSTLPSTHEEVIALGAAAYAALEYANFSITEIGVSEETPERWRELGDRLLERYQSWLRDLAEARGAAFDARVTLGQYRI